MLPKILSRFFLFLILSLFGCQGHITYAYTHNVPGTTLTYINIYIDNDFSQNDKTIIDNDILEWNYALNKQMILSVKDYNFDMSPEKLKEINQNDWLILKVNSDCSFKPPEIPEHQTLAWVSEIGGNHIFVIRDRISSEDDLKEILLHEMGHALGAKHVVKTLMNPQHNHYNYYCIDKNTAEQVAQYRNLNINQMNYCFVQ